MPTSATGIFEIFLPGMSRSNGFSLIEILVVLVMISVLAVGVTLSLPSAGQRDQAEMAERQQVQLETLLLLAQRRAEPLGLRVDTEGGLHIENRRDGRWQAATDLPFRPQPLPEGWRWGGIRVGQQSLGPDTPLALTAGLPPAFVLTLEGPGRSMRLRVSPIGEVSQEKPGAQP